MIKNLLLAIGTALATNTAPIQKNNESVFNNENEIRELQPKKATQYNTIDFNLETYTKSSEYIDSNSRTWISSGIKYGTTKATLYTDVIEIMHVDYKGIKLTSTIDQTSPNGTVYRSYSTITYLEILPTTNDIVENDSITIKNDFTWNQTNVIDFDLSSYVNTIYWLYPQNDIGEYVLNENNTTSEKMNFISNKLYGDEQDTYLKSQEEYDLGDYVFGSPRLLQTSYTYENLSTQYYNYIIITNNYRSQLNINLSHTFTNISYTLVLDVQQEVIDLPGLLFTILGMPFSFISQAFNLTLFPGTAYSVNVANLLFAVITGLLVIIIFRKLLR